MKKRIKPQAGQLCTPTLTRGGVGQGKGASPNTPMGAGLQGGKCPAETLSVVDNCRPLADECTGLSPITQGLSTADAKLEFCKVYAESQAVPKENFRMY